MRAICVDDEPLIRDLTVSMCRDLPQLTEVEGFGDAQEALDYMNDHPADVALLDINMPDMDGITLAARIKERHPDTAIIFVTGYPQYAVDAFALHVSGYLLKPISFERLAEEIGHALPGSAHITRSVPHIAIQTFGNFEVLVDGREVAFPRSKAKEILAYLVDRQGRTVTRAEVFEKLWEDEIYDRPRQKQLDVIIRSLRTTLEENGIGEILEMQRGVLRVVPENFDCDLYRFFEGESEAVNAYQGEYMSPYTWGNMMGAYADRLHTHRV